VRKVDPERQQAKRRQILEAAGDCFARRGFHATTTAEICTAAGMSPGNLFHYFPSKNAIIEALAEEEWRDTAAYFAAIDDDPPDPLEVVLSFLDVVMVFASDRSYSRLALEVAAETLRNPVVCASVAAGDTEMRDGLAALLRKAAARGQIDPELDPVQSANWIAALIDGVFSRLALDTGFDPAREAPMLRRVVGRFLAKPGRGA